jgi:transposase-like protein
MPRQRRNFSGAEKIAILREHLIEKVPISEVCDKHGLPPTMFYAWQKKLFEEGAAVFEFAKGGRAKSSRQQAAEQRKIDALEAKVREKNEVLAELMGEHVALKKSLGQI